jgi:hypothetical protein
VNDFKDLQEFQQLEIRKKSFFCDSSIEWKRTFWLFVMTSVRVLLTIVVSDVNFEESKAMKLKFVRFVKI